MTRSVHRLTFPRAGSILASMPWEYWTARCWSIGDEWRLRTPDGTEARLNDALSAWGSQNWELAAIQVAQRPGEYGTHYESIYVFKRLA